MEDVKREPSKRLLHLDILRIMAIFFVAFNHTGNRGYTYFSQNRESILYFLYMAFSVLCKIAVPVFFMISGALLLHRQETLRQLFSKRVFRMVLVLIVASLPYYLWVKPTDAPGVLDFFSFIYSDCVASFIWYLYSYIGFLLLLPFLRSMVKNMEKKDFIYLFVGHIVLVGIIPCLEFCLSGGKVTLNDSFSSVIFVTQNIFFALMGYFIERVWNEQIGKKTVLCLISGSIVSIFATCAITHYQLISSVENTEQIERFFECFISIPAIAVFILIKSISRKIKGNRIQKILSVLGASVFGVYLIEKFVRVLTEKVYIVLSPIVGSFVASLGWCFATCCVALVIIVILKHIPFVKIVVNKFI